VAEDQDLRDALDRRGTDLVGLFCSRSGLGCTLVSKVYDHPALVFQLQIGVTALEFVLRRSVSTVAMGPWSFEFPIDKPDDEMVKVIVNILKWEQAKSEVT
jgi:hypothetical protein